MAKADLYKWTRRAKPKFNTHQDRLTSDDDISRWIEMVEDASGKAVAETFGKTYNSDVKRTKSHSDPRFHDAAYAEAQDLLNEWVNEKLHLGLDQDDCDDFSYERPPAKTPTEIRREWDDLVRLDDEDDNLTILHEMVNSSRSSQRTRRARYEEDDSVVVDSIMQSMLKKQLVKDDFLTDLGLEDSKPKVDPRTKMQLRHQQVKENREKRIKEKEKKLKEMQLKQEARLQARQMMMKEEKDKELKQKQEELEIQKEMTKIRKEFEEQRIRETERKQREERKRRQRDRLEREEFEKQLQLEKKQRTMEHQLLMEKKQKVMEKIQEIERKKTLENLRLKHQCFSAWYNQVMESRMKLGKARATADWKLLFRTFTSWKSVVFHQQLEREAGRFQDFVKQMHKKELMANEHHRRRVLMKCFSQWITYCQQEKHAHILFHNEQQTKDRMQRFLERATADVKGKPVGVKDNSSDVCVKGKSVVSPDSICQNSTDQKVQQLFDGGKSKADVRGVGRSRSSDQQTTRSVSLPTEPWQVSKKHLKLLTGSPDDGDTSVQSADDKVNSARSSRTQTPRSTSEVRSSRRVMFVSNNFEHRHLAQQKILAEQQRQLKEQRQLIEELQYLQRQQLLQQQLTQQQLMTQLHSDKSKVIAKQRRHSAEDLSSEIREDGSQREDRMDEGPDKTGKIEQNPSLSGADSSRDTDRTTARSASSRTTDNSRHVRFLEGTAARGTGRKTEGRRGRKET